MKRGRNYSCQFIPEAVENLALDFNGIQDHNGIFQVNINLNKDKGKEGLTGYLSELETIFNRGTALNYGGVTGFVERVYYNSGVVNNEWFTVSFSVDVRSLFMSELGDFDARNIQKNGRKNRKCGY